MNKVKQPFWHSPSRWTCGPRLHQMYQGIVEKVHPYTDRKGIRKIMVWIDGQHYNTNYHEKIFSRLTEMTKFNCTSLIPFYVQTHNGSERLYISDSPELY